MRGTVAKRLRREARKIATERKQFKSSLLSRVMKVIHVRPENGDPYDIQKRTVHYGEGFRRIYRDLKKARTGA